MSQVKRVRLAGGCACGGVRFEVDGVVRPVIACHCGTCRRTSGHYWASTEAHRADLRLIADGTLKWFRSSDFARRGFCAECGSSLFYRRDDADRISIAAGALDLPTGLSLVEHICTAEAGDCYTLDPALSRHPDAHISERWRLP